MSRKQRANASDDDNDDNDDLRLQVNNDNDDDDDEDDQVNSRSQKRSRHHRPRREDASDDDDADAEEDPGRHKEVEMINVEFVVNSPQESDFHGIKAMLEQLLPANVINLSEVADVVVNLGNADVGNVIKVSDGDDNLFGVLSVFHFEQHQKLSVTKQLRNWLLRNCDSGADKSRLDTALNSPDSKLAWIVNERFINLPHQLAPPLYAALLDQINYAVQDGDIPPVTHLLYIAKAYSEKDEAGNVGPLAYYFPEDDLFQREATVSFSFPYTRPRTTLGVVATSVGDEFLATARTISIVPFEKLQKISEALTAEYSGGVTPRYL